MNKLTRQDAAYLNSLEDKEWDIIGRQMFEDIKFSSVSTVPYKDDTDLTNIVKMELDRIRKEAKNHGKPDFRAMDIVQRKSILYDRKSFPPPITDD